MHHQAMSTLLSFTVPEVRDTVQLEVVEATVKSEYFEGLQRYDMIKRQDKWGNAWKFTTGQL